jgi:hypothetical protein
MPRVTVNSLGKDIEEFIIYRADAIDGAVDVLGLVAGVFIELANDLYNQQGINVSEELAKDYEAVAQIIDQCISQLR